MPRLLEKFGLKNCKPMYTLLVSNEKLCQDDEIEALDQNLYRSIVGSLLYLIATRPDIMLASSLPSRFMYCPTKPHLGTTKVIDHGIHYGKGQTTILVGFCDNDWGGSEDDSKSISKYVFTFRSSMFSWVSVKQQNVALSTIEVEYMAAA